VVVGTALVIGDPKNAFRRKHVHASKVEEEVKRLYEGVERAREQIVAVSESMQEAAGHEPAAILGAYVAMLTDPLLLARVEAKVRTDLICAEWAVVASSEEILSLFDRNASSAQADTYLLERRHDVEFVSDRLVGALTGRSHRPLAHFTVPTVIVARDLSPADTAGIAKEPVLAFVTEVGTKTSHTAIMARALELPAVVGLSDALTMIRSGDTVIVDGLRGEVIVNPNAITLEEARLRSARHMEFSRDLLSSRHDRAATRCGVPVALKANIELAAEAVLALDQGADGVGLYRTEFIYIDRSTMPSEEEQYELYRSVVETMAPRPVTLRTFDIGGDKFVSTFQLPSEMNPALGLRAVRLALRRPDVFLTQLRAMVRASAHGEVSIMVPMIASLTELRDVRALIARAEAEVDAAGHARAQKIPVGIMIEVPAAVMLADVFAKHADFFSVGTNDLVQYTLAVDRTNQSLAPLATPLHPAILRMLDTVLRSAEAHNRPVSLCGAMASDPLAALLLVGLGFRELSMESAAVPEIKAALRRFTLQECRDVAMLALACEETAAIEELLALSFAARIHDILTGASGERAS
jgi:phosphotransferase system enzyme I (PtsI)